MGWESIIFRMGADSSAMKTGLDAAKKSVQSFKNEVQGMLTGLFAGIGIQQLIADFARIQDIANMFGTTAEAVQKVRGAAEQAGTSVELVAKAMAKLRTDSDGLAKLGIDAQSFADADLDQQILAVAQALENTADPQERINLALEVFGTKGKEMLPLLIQGYSDLKASMDSTAVASNQTVAELAAADDKIAAFTNNIKVFGAEILGFFTKVAQSIGSIIGTYISTLTQSISDAGQALQQIIHGDFSGALKTAKASGGNGIEQLKQGGSLLADIWKAPEQATKKANPFVAESALETEEQAKKREEGQRKVDEISQRNHDREIERIERENEKREAGQLRVDLISQRNHMRYVEAQEKAEERLKDKRIRAAFKARQEALGFAFESAPHAGSSFGQQLSGVNYSVINSEAQKSIQLQQEMAAYLKSIDEKEWNIEIPEAE